MSELHHECGVAAIYHLPGREISRLCPEQGPGARLAADAADAAGHAEPRPAFRRHDHATIPSGSSSSTPTRNRRRQRGLPPEPPRQVRKPDAGVRRPGGHRPRPLRHLRRAKTAATPSRSSGTTCKSTSGSASPSTANWPTTPSCATSCWPTATTTWPARPTPKSSCTRSAASCRATGGRR